MKQIFKNISTIGSFGYLPGSGTLGTLIAMPFALGLCEHWSYGYICGLLTIVSFFIIKNSLDFFGSDDPSEIILDEFVGCFILFLGVSISTSSILAAFLLYRFLDIVKPFGIKKIEQMPGAIGILADDCVAALLANIIVRCLNV